MLRSFLLRGRLALKVGDKEVTSLRLVSLKLSRLAFPPLQRPAVPEGAPPTRELVEWAVAFYCFSLLSHFREMLRSFLFMVKKGHIPSGFLVARCLFELGAHTYYVHKHVTQYFDSGDLQRAWGFLVEINMGSRYMREEYGDDEEDRPYFLAPREIAKVMRCFEEWEPCRGKAVTEYSFLSEFAHPNMAAFAHYYSMRPGESGFGEVVFQSYPIIRLLILKFRFRSLQRYITPYDCWSVLAKERSHTG